MVSRNDKRLEKAKKMFYDYECNHFYMFKEGELEKYEKYKVSEKQEKIWHDEYIAYWLGRLSVDDLTALWHLRNSWTQEIIPTLISMSAKGDSYAKFWFAETILRLSGKQTRINKQGREAAIKIFKSLIKGKIRISDNHRAEISQGMMVALNASTPEEYLVKYSKRKLTDLRIKLSTL